MMAYRCALPVQVAPFPLRGVFDVEAASFRFHFFDWLASFLLARYHLGRLVTTIFCIL